MREVQWHNTHDLATWWLPRGRTWSVKGFVWVNELLGWKHRRSTYMIKNFDNFDNVCLVSCLDRPKVLIRHFSVWLIVFERSECFHFTVNSNISFFIYIYQLFLSTGVLLEMGLAQYLWDMWHVMEQSSLFWAAVVGKLVSGVHILRILELSAPQVSRVLGGMGGSFPFVLFS